MGAGVYPCLLRNCDYNFCKARSILWANSVNGTPADLKSCSARFAAAMRSGSRCLSLIGISLSFQRSCFGLRSTVAKYVSANGELAAISSLLIFSYASKISWTGAVRYAPIKDVNVIMFGSRPKSKMSRNNTLQHCAECHSLASMQGLLMICVRYLCQPRWSSSGPRPRQLIQRVLLQQLR